jgi:hypothetical protein
MIFIFALLLRGFNVVRLGWGEATQLICNPFGYDREIRPTVEDCLELRTVQPDFPLGRSHQEFFSSYEITCLAFGHLPLFI